jgi:hypothetical protein
MNSEGSLIILNDKKGKEKNTLDPRLPALQML